MAILPFLRYEVVVLSLAQYTIVDQANTGTVRKDGLTLVWCLSFEFILPPNIQVEGYAKTADDLATVKIVAYDLGILRGQQY